LSWCCLKNMNVINSFINIKNPLCTISLNLSVDDSYKRLQNLHYRSTT
jgi:hypothetical protein